VRLKLVNRQFPCDVSEALLLVSVAQKAPVSVLGGEFSAHQLRIVAFSLGGPGPINV
jgi:hypothetical protein